MEALINNPTRIASWDTDFLKPDSLFLVHDTIATEDEQVESPIWAACLDELLKLWNDAARSTDPQPNQRAVEAAIAWTHFLRKHFPGEPPTCLVPEPAGGIILERHVTQPNGEEFIWEWTFYNNGHAERTDYRNGRVLGLVPLPFHPPQSAG